MTQPCIWTVAEILKRARHIQQGERQIETKRRRHLANMEGRRYYGKVVLLLNAVTKKWRLRNTRPWAIASKMF